MGPDAYVVVQEAEDSSRAPVEFTGRLDLAYRGGSLSVWRSLCEAALPVVAITPTLVAIGEVYASRVDAEEASEPFSLAGLAHLGFEAICRRLVELAWGRYVLIGRTQDGVAAFRDPSGALDCVTWAADGRRFWSSRIPKTLDAWLPGGVSIDWTAVARLLRDPPAIGGASALRNIEAIAAGALWMSGPGLSRSTHQIWRPAEIARQGPMAGDPADMMRSRVRSSVATLVRPYRRLLAEISGGLDSAIVASSIHTAASLGSMAPAMRWINFATGDREGDERDYARGIAARLGIELTERFKPSLRYDPDDLAQIGSDFRVGVAALDPDYDRSLVAEARDHRAQALITGQGGDVVFLQMATDEVLADRLRGEGRLELSELLAHSRRYRRSVWRTLATTLWRAASTGRPSRPVPDYLVEPPSPSSFVPHPWLEDLDGLPPAKTIQILALAGAQNVFGPSRRADTMRTLHPLLSQPVVELGLSLATYVLTRGGADRALAREAFSAGLPDSILGRRSKGSLQAFYGRAVASSLDVLRPFLLDGLLAHEGLIRIDRLEPLLDGDVLLQRNIYVPLLHLVAVEAWVRGWSARIAAIKARPSTFPV